MGKELGYGQPMGGIAQTAFIVPDLQRGDRPLGDQLQCRARSSCSITSSSPGQTYRGEESTADITIGDGLCRAIC